VQPNNIRPNQYLIQRNVLTDDSPHFVGTLTNNQNSYPDDPSHAPIAYPMRLKLITANAYPESSIRG